MDYIKSILKLYSFLSQQRKRQIYILIILMSIFSFLELLTISSFIPLLASLVSTNNSIEALPFPFSYFSSQLQPDKFLLYVSATFLFITALSSSIRVFTAKRQWKLIYQITSDISQVMFKKIVNQDYDFFLKAKSNILISSINSSLKLLTTGAVIPILHILGSILLSFVLLVGLFLISASSAILTIIVLGFSYYYFLVSNKNILKKASISVVKSDTQRQKILTESIGSIRDIIIDNTQDIFIKEYNFNDSPFWSAQAKSSFLGAYPRFVLEGIALFCFCLFAYFQTVTSSSTTSIPTIGSFSLAAIKLLPAAQLLFLSISQMRFSSKAVLGVLEYVSLPQNVQISNIPPKKINNLKLTNVYFSYHKKDKTKVLNDVSLEINPGDSIGIIGPSGSGKSTLLDIILGLISPDSGSILIDGEKINEENILNWRKSIAHVPQNIYLRNSNIAENIAFGQSINEIDFDLINEVSKISCLEKYIKSNNDGFFTEVGENGLNLSGGQRQRIGIARALYKKANFIFLDEATSALDNETELEIMDSMYNMINKKGISMVAISHKKSILSRCSRIYEIKDGKLFKV